jgi:hypothetical protein
MAAETHRTQLFPTNDFAVRVKEIARPAMRAA